MKFSTGFILLVFCASWTYGQQRRTTPFRISNRVGEATARTPTPPQNDETLSRAVVDLALALGREAAESNGASSAADVFSPVSIMGVLNLLLLGADGISRSELLGALKMNTRMTMPNYHRKSSAMMSNLLSKNPQSMDVLPWKAVSCIKDDYEDYDDLPAQTTPKTTQLRIANGIFSQINFPISSKFIDIANQYYGAEAQRVNFKDSFSAAALINKWVTQATNGRIREVSNGQFSPETSMMIASSLYFKASWEHEFTAKSTRPRDFYPDGSGRPSFKVDSMTLTECLPYYFDRNAGVRIIGFPYSDNSTTMYVIMPQNSTRAKLRSLQLQLTSTQIDNMIKSMARKTATVTFPRMELTSSTNLENSFRRLGIKSIFHPQQSNLRIMLEPTAQGRVPLHVSQITHKVNLSVDEKGTEGSAVTVTLVDRVGSSVNFITNGPFLIYVRHDPTRLPIFYGAVYDPRG
ncbi:serine protease inhibitor 28Dc-like [Uranotaenia lowii]|uniref:serine protease inhibitor 28Dc-like n=1 Tax=Uranotaenia lowii TaxID=190385 RepID=UPI00247AEA3A|nr:serine protease inhibitor 28Dc-like [Uranotaenia lowii]